MTQAEIDKESIKQLHRVVLGLSKSCFELKKLCATVVGSSLVLFAAFTSQRIDYVFFAGSAVIIVFFWIADSQSYYYQEKIRLRMKEITEQLLEGAAKGIVLNSIGMPLSPQRVGRSVPRRIIHSVFNWSMIFYYGLLFIDAVTCLAYYFGFLHSTP